MCGCPVAGRRRAWGITGFRRAGKKTVTIGGNTGDAGSLTNTAQQGRTFNTLPMSSNGTTRVALHHLHSVPHRGVSRRQNGPILPIPPVFPDQASMAANKHPAFPAGRATNKSPQRVRNRYRARKLTRAPTYVWIGARVVRTPMKNRATKDGKTKRIASSGLRHRLQPTQPYSPARPLRPPNRRTMVSACTCRRAYAVPNKPEAGSSRFHLWAEPVQATIPRGLRSFSR